MPNQPLPQHNPRTIVMQFGHLLQQELFPRIEEQNGLLSEQMQLLVSVMSLISLTRFLPASNGFGRPARDRVALATAFIAKAILNLPTTRDLINRLKVDLPLRRICGWSTPDCLPHESKFSRVFADFATTRLPERLHAAVIEVTQKHRLIGHIARDATAIPAREHFPETARQKAHQRPAQGTTSKRKLGQHARSKASERGTRIQRQRRQKDVSAMVAELPRGCDIGAKKNSKGHEQYWRGYKLHLDVADGQVPISALLTSASVHDSQVAVPLMRLTSQRVTYCYDLMDAAYDADELLAESRALNHVPIVGNNGRRGTRKPSQCPKIFPPKPAPSLDFAEQERYKERTMSERVNARLKDEFGVNHLRVRGPAKVMAHIMYGVLALTVDQWLRLGRRE